LAQAILAHLTSSHRPPAPRDIMSSSGTDDEEMQRAFEAVKAAKAMKAVKARRSVKITRQVQQHMQQAASRGPDDQHSGQHASGRPGDTATRPGSTDCQGHAAMPVPHRVAKPELSCSASVKDS